MMDCKKYVKQYYMPPVRCMKWAEKECVEKAPVWCSVDLRDGNHFPRPLRQNTIFCAR